MKYVLKYTSVENISRRLRGRLNVNPQLGDNIGAISGTVDNDLIYQVAQQIETKLDLGLGQLYHLPIPQNAQQALTIIGAIAEKLIISEIAVTHFRTQLNPETGADMGFGETLRKQAFKDAEMIFAGHGIYVPGIMPTNSNKMTPAQPLVLPGVQLLISGDRPDTFSRHDSFVFRRELPEEEQLWQ